MREQKYGTDPAERLEIIEPRAAAPSRAPIVYIHGGGWIAGRKESYTRYLSFFANAGYPIFNVEYPLAPEHPHPGILRSLLGALDWIRTNHSETTGFHVMGDSAGGNLAMMLGLLAANPALVRSIDPQRSSAMPLACHSVVSLYGVLDRLSWLEDGFPGAEIMLESYAGRAAFEPAVGPELAITPMDLEFEAAPPSFLCAGTEDQLCRSSRLFAERLASGSGKVVHKEYAGEGHGFFNGGRTKSDDQLNADVLEFLEGVDPHAG
ncbi:MAG: alpha/beta hydrolase [Deltaproteobacteria bacterium]|nr:alpha/beta hydrolase [Deltaproteobacteria bacterium]